MAAVSVVVATYNRSNVLRLALESARAQTLADWELIVVGDACTDDTEEVVRGLGDARISFVNLPENVGEQSGPNNHGIRLTTAPLVAFLNHDDLWFSDHLERCVAALEAGEAGMVFSVVGLVGEDGHVALMPSWSGGYEPVRVVAPASGWVVRRETIDRVGPWRPARQSFVAPSQDWLRRARAAGERLEQVPYLTVLAVQAGLRRGSYSRRDDHEQRELARRMGEPGYREELLAHVAVRASAELVRPRGLVENLSRAAGDVVRRALPDQLAPLRAALRHGRRGKLVAHRRRVRGLAPK